MKPLSEVSTINLQCASGDLTNPIIGINIGYGTNESTCYIQNLTEMRLFHMSKSLTDIFLNPIRMRIAQAFYSKERMTTSEIHEKMKDIPRTTFYRNISTMIDADILTVVDEKKIRGSVERTLSINKQSLAERNIDSIKDGAQMPLAFLMNKYALFHSYFEGDDINLTRDKLFLLNYTLMMDDEEFNQFFEKLQKLIADYNHEYKEGRKPRNLSFVHAPMENEVE